jgi:arylsulfatase A-like enzyme
MIKHLFVSLAIVWGLTAVSVSNWRVTAMAAEVRPNIVTIVVDDLDIAAVAEMPSVKSLLTETGTTFTQFFAPTPLCCPSRVSMLRGQYAHNHGVLRNTGEDAGFPEFLASGYESETLATLLQADGYSTALIGKYLNGYVPADDPRIPVTQTYIPPGWDTWISGVTHAAYDSFDYTLNVNGSLVDFGDAEDDYLTDVLTTYAVDFLDRAATRDQPYFLFLTPYSPHSPAVPAPRHQGMFHGATAPRTPSFNEADIADKPAWVQAGGSLSERKQQRIDESYQRRLESLQAVDEMVQAVMVTLAEHDQLESTYILFLSDNGFFLGEHRQPRGKGAPYDAAAHIPLIIRGPSISAGTQIDGIALTNDLLPTLADLAGVATPSFVDGRSLVPLWTGHASPWRQTAIIEGFGLEFESAEREAEQTPAFQALRTANMLYVEYETGERELYDLQNDPFELHNLINEVPADDLRRYAEHLAALAGCAAAECRTLEDEPMAPVPSG